MNNGILNLLNNTQKPWKFLAPMVGNSEESYRILARRHGAHLCYTEMVNSRVYNKSRSNPLSNQWYTTSQEDRPLVIQICGDDPQEMLKTCLSIQDHCDAIDINFGCPQEVAKKGHYGAYLQDEWELIKEIVQTCSEGIKVPLFCKIRVFESIEKTVEYARLFESSGASLLAVHGRTRDQRGERSGLASWEHIKAVKEALKIPVIANGNMIYTGDIQRCYECTGCDGVMIAEPHLYNPTIFDTADCNDIERDGKSDGKNMFSTNILNEFIEISTERHFDGGAFKSHAFKILRGILLKIPDLRSELDSCKSLEDYRLLIRKVEKLIEEGVLNEDDLIMRPYIRQ